MKNKKNFLSLRVWMLLMILGFICVVPAHAAYSEQPGVKPVADEVVNTGGISFIPKVSCEQLQLFVARPDGTVFSKVFPGGSQPYIDLSSICGSNSCDGSYTYELRVIPFNQKKVRGEEPTEDTAPSQEALTQSGHFLVQG
ncbi:MAG TPA: hypothetical protein VK186_08475, partial [Candidatus Deferrimicrobium sp.]|nr:hypothetical protein [Candidatus Deferrimicrobium sp.]